MKIASLITLTFLLSFNSFAQSGMPEPIQLNRTFLVNSAGLPEEFLLFVPDSAVQILFNPARANNFSDNFVYVNYLSDADPAIIYPMYYLPDVPIEFTGTGGLQKTSSINFPTLYQDNFTTSKNPTFSAAALINAGSARWLFELTNGISRYNNLLNYNYFSNEIRESNNYYSLANYRNNQDFTNEGMVTSFKITHIFKTDELNFSEGIYAIFHKNDSRSKLFAFSEDYVHRDASSADSALYRSYQLDTGKNDENENDSRNVIGLEIALNNTKFDYVGSIDYQFGDNSYKNDLGMYQYHYDSTKYYPEWNVYRNERTSKSLQSSSQKSYIINFTNYYRHQLGLILPDDDLFLTLNLFYSWGEISFEDNTENINLYYNQQGTDGDTVTSNNSGQFDVKDWGVTLGAGYVLTKKLDDLSVLTGLKVLGNIEYLSTLRTANITSGIPGFEKDVLKPSLFSVTLPIYIHYSPVQWFSVYGGMNYTYTYTRNKTSASLNVTRQESYYPRITEYNFNLNTVRQGWQSYKSIYLGCELRHSSGLKVYVYWNEDLTLIRNWNVSLGYQF